MSAPLRRPAFAWFFAGQSISRFGSAMSPVALAFAVLGAAHSSSALGVVLAANLVPHIGLLLVGGVTADRISRRTVLLVANLGSAATQGAVAGILLVHAFTLQAVAGLEFANGVLGAFTTPALRGVLPQLVPADSMQRANSLLGSASSAAKIAGPALAGLLVAATGGGVPIAVDAATFVVAAGCLCRTELGPLRDSARASVWQDIRAGIHLFRTTPWLWPVSVAFAVVNLVQTGSRQVLGPQLAAEHGGPQTWGFMLGARGLGLLVVSIVMYRVLPRRLLRTSQLASLLGALPLLALGADVGAPWLLSAGFVGGLGSAVSDLGWTTTLQTHIPTDRLSRVAALDDLASYVVIPIGQLAVGPVANAVGAHHVCLGAAAVWLVAVSLPLCRHAVRTLPARPSVRAGAP